MMKESNGEKTLKIIHEEKQYKLINHQRVYTPGAYHIQAHYKI